MTELTCPLLHGCAGFQSNSARVWSCWAWSGDMYTPWRLLAALGLCLGPPASHTGIDQTVVVSTVEEGTEKEEEVQDEKDRTPGLNGNPSSRTVDANFLSPCSRLPESAAPTVPLACSASSLVCPQVVTPGDTHTLGCKQVTEPRPSSQG